MTATGQWGYRARGSVDGVQGECRGSAAHRRFLGHVVLDGELESSRRRC